MRALIVSAVALIAMPIATPASAQVYGGGYGYGGDVVRCESSDGRTRECSTNGGRVVLERQHSNAACIEGRTWGYGRNGIWVSDGCRADFRIVDGGYNGNYNGSYNSGYYGNQGGYYGNQGGYYGQNGYYGNQGGYYGNQGNGYGYGYGSTVRCESSDGRVNRCSTNGRGRAQLVRQLSRSACIEGRTWGSESGSVWVSQGCRAEFTVNRGSYGGGWNNGSYGYGNQLFRCESNDGGMRQCTANTRAGVQLVRQLSRAACIEGRTWGYGRNGIWVSQGCRAEFRTY